MHEILDNADEKSFKKVIVKTLRGSKNIIPLCFLLLIAIATIFEFIADNFNTFSVFHIIGFTLLLANFVCYFIARKYFKFVLMVFVVLGFCNVVNLNVNIIWFSFCGLPFQPIFCFIGFCYYALNFSLVNDYVMPTSVNVDQEIVKQKYYEREVQKFRFHFAKYSKEQLELVIEKETSLKSAKEAARLLLN